MATFNDFEQRKKKTKWHANREVVVFIYIYIIYNGKKQEEEEKNMINKRQTITKFKSERAQETEYKLKKK
jgi:hypothetical protein